MKKLIPLFFLFFVQSLFAQTADSIKVYRIGIFANLFIDSSFASGKYKFSNQMPKHLLPGLDFTEGTLTAFDSLMVNEKIEVKIFDVRSASQSIAILKSKNIFDSLDLMIGSISGADYRQMAEIAFQKNILFVSATFPNDGGVTNNPYTLILNSTLPVHCEAIYSFLLRTYATDNIIYLRKKGQQEDRLASYFNNANKTSTGGVLLKWKTLNIADSVKTSDLLPLLDSSSTNIIICGSLDEVFGTQLIKTVQKLPKKYPINLMGMPTWESMKDMNSSEWKDLNIFYSATFYNNAGIFATNFNKTFTEKTFGRPSDLAYKGFETAWYFTNLLLKHKKALLQNLNDKTFKVFTDFDFKPVLNKTSGKPDYIENKRIYILKRNNGLVSRMN